MKKVLCLGLTIAMVMGMCSVALATETERYDSSNSSWTKDSDGDGEYIDDAGDGATELGFQVNASYYVTIPSKIAVSNNSETDLTITASGKIAYGKKVDVSIQDPSDIPTATDDSVTFGGLVNVSGEYKIPFRAYASEATSLDSPVDLAAGMTDEASKTNGTLTYVTFKINNNPIVDNDNPTVASFSGNNFSNSIATPKVGTYDTTGLISAYWKAKLQFVVSLNNL